MQFYSYVMPFSRNFRNNNNTKDILLFFLKNFFLLKMTLVADLIPIIDDDEKMAGKNDEPEVTDVRALLAQKEKDLILAAELGKALLEKNEDLSQQNEKMTEEFSKQLEVRRKLI